MAQPQRLRGQDADRRLRVAFARQDVEDDVGGVDTLIKGFAAGRFDARQAVGEDSRENGHHLSIAVVRVVQFVPHPLQVCRQQPVLERRAVPQRPRLAGQHRNIMPGIVEATAAAKAADVLADTHPVLANDDAIGIGLDLDRPSDGT